MNAQFKDIGVLSGTLDLAYGKDENDFELSMSLDDDILEVGNYIYIDGTEYGGIIDGITVDTAREAVGYNGRTWHGILASKVIEPDSGQNYYTINSDANAAVQTLIDRHGLSELFNVSASTSTNVNHQFFRYTNLYHGIARMLKSVGYKLKITHNASGVLLEAVPAVDYTTDEQFDASQIDFLISKQKAANHIIALGKGDLAAREVVHRYIDQNGDVSDTQHYIGIDEITITHESKSEGADLVAEAEKKLKEANKTSAFDISLNADFNQYDIGDIVGAKERITGVEIAKKVVKKIVKIKGGDIEINYEVE